MAQAGPDKSLQLAERLETVRAEHGLIGLGAVIATPADGVVALAVVGERTRGGDPIQRGDAWHIGSNTKMLTALGWGRLVEEGNARWGMTLGEIFTAEELAPAWRNVTIEDLLAHRSGAAPNPGIGWMIGTGRNDDPVEVQREALVTSTLGKKPASARGKYVYSNLGYIIAGRAMEIVAGDGQTYEALIQRLVIEKAPEGAGEGFGFGPPAEGIQGHRKGLLGRMVAAGVGPSADNAPAFASAGTAHISLRGHALLLLPFLEGPQALPSKLRAKLLTPYPDAKSDYALGWGVQTSKAGRLTYLHAGSNTMWLSQVVVMPDPGAVIIINTNQADKAAEAAVKDLTGNLIDWVVSDAAE